jgi:hypothetical protein
MSETVNVRSVQALIDLKSRLSHFTSDSLLSLQNAEQQIQHVEEWLQQRKAFWQFELNRRQEDLRAVKAALAQCEASGYRDQHGYYHAPDCSFYTKTVLQAQLKCQEDQNELNNIEHWIYRVDQATSIYRSQVRGINRFITSNLPKANSCLGKKIVELQTYLSGGVAATGFIGNQIDTDDSGTINLYEPYPLAQTSIPSQGPDPQFKSFKRDAMDTIGYAYGCHSCGTKDPGTKSGQFIPDHQPPTKYCTINQSQSLYLHCLSCSRKQGGLLHNYMICKK